MGQKVFYLLFDTSFPDIIQNVFINISACDLVPPSEVPVLLRPPRLQPAQEQEPWPARHRHSKGLSQSADGSGKRNFPQKHIQIIQSLVLFKNAKAP